MLEVQIQHPLKTSHGEINIEIDFQLPQGKLLGIVGPSGEGKTTLLRIIAGLLKPSFAHIKFGGQLWNHTESRLCLPPQNRSVGMVFQDYALFPNMTVTQHLDFANKEKNKQLAEELKSVMGLQELLQRYPHQLSGGQQQRLALARALMNRPQVLLLDEPLSALDMDHRKRLQSYIEYFHQQHKLTSILVSHNLEEVFQLSDAIFQLKEGKLANINPPDLILKQGVSIPVVITNIQPLDDKRLVTFQVGDFQFSQKIDPPLVTNWMIGQKLILNVNSGHFEHLETS